MLKAAPSTYRTILVSKVMHCISVVSTLYNKTDSSELYIHSAYF